MKKEEKEERENRIQNHINYWNFVEKINNDALDALDNLSVDDIISALDRVKTTMIQQQVIVEITELQQEAESEPEEEEIGEHPNVELKSTMPMIDPAGLLKEIKGVINN